MRERLAMCTNLPEARVQVNLNYYLRLSQSFYSTTTIAGVQNIAQHDY